LHGFFIRPVCSYFFCFINWIHLII
jgi:hypothetical protein